MTPTKYSMRINEIAFSKPLTPEQQRLAGLKDTKERANQALAAERKRQQVSAALKWTPNLGQVFKWDTV